MIAESKFPGKLKVFGLQGGGGAGVVGRGGELGDELLAFCFVGDRPLAQQFEFDAQAAHFVGGGVGLVFEGRQRLLGDFSRRSVLLDVGVGLEELATAVVEFEAAIARRLTRLLQRLLKTVALKLELADGGITLDGERVGEQPQLLEGCAVVGVADRFNLGDVCLRCRLERLQFTARQLQLTVEPLPLPFVLDRFLRGLGATLLGGLQPCPERDDVGLTAREFIGEAFDLPVQGAIGSTVHHR